MKISKTFILGILASGALLVCGSARAGLIDMQATWSGAYWGNSASAVATFTLNDSLVNNPGGTVDLFNSGAITNFQLTLSGSTWGGGLLNGTMYSDAFFGAVLSTDIGTLDFTQELVGQSTLRGPWGWNGSELDRVGDFNLFSLAMAPSASGGFNFLAGGWTGEKLVLTSLAPVTPAAPPVAAVPETSTWLMGFLALGTVAFLAVRRRQLA